MFLLFIVDGEKRTSEFPVASWLWTALAIINLLLRSCFVLFVCVGFFFLVLLLKPPQQPRSFRLTEAVKRVYSDFKKKKNTYYYYCWKKKKEEAQRICSDKKATTGDKQMLFFLPFFLFELSHLPCAANDSGNNLLAPPPLSFSPQLFVSC